MSSEPPKSRDQTIVLPPRRGVQRAGVRGWILDSVWSRSSLVAVPIGVMAGTLGGLAAGMIAGGVVWLALSTISMAARTLGGDIPQDDELPSARLLEEAEPDAVSSDESESRGSRRN